MTRSSPLSSPDKVKRAAKLRENGLTYEAIGLKLGCGKNTVTKLLAISRGEQPLMPPKVPHKITDRTPAVTEMQRISVAWLMRPMK